MIRWKNWLAGTTATGHVCPLGRLDRDRQDMESHWGGKADGFAKIDDVCCAFQKCGQTSCFAAVQLVNKSPFTEPYYL